MNEANVISDHDINVVVTHLPFLYIYIYRHACNPTATIIRRCPNEMFNYD
jgi:hypothetical protein